MKIILAQHFGLCFGVRDAIAQAKELAATESLTILGELVHNPIVREQLRSQGINEGSLDDPTAPSRRVMITAHGASDGQRQKWRTAGFDLADATCPLVHHAHQQLKQLVAAGYFPVVIGKPGHVEVRGLTEDFPEAVVIDAVADVSQLPPRTRYGVISQTTQPIQHVQGLVESLKARYPEAEVLFVDTVCKPTKDRQSSLQALIAEADTIVVVGGRQSNNTRQLVETCRAAGRRTIHVERTDEIDASNFAKAVIVGVTAGTSTLRETVSSVLQRLEEISSAQINETKSGRRSARPTTANHPSLRSPVVGRAHRLPGSEGEKTRPENQS
jgi:4-hydroxy-3-methylbut-2-en-1-yl diphosphate reductase